MWIGTVLIAPFAAVILAALPTIAYADTIEPAVIGPAELSVGEFVAVVVCAAIVAAAGIYALVRIRRRRQRETAPDAPAPGQDESR
jgi:hypothetical protein